MVYKLSDLESKPAQKRLASRCPLPQIGSGKLRAEPAGIMKAKITVTPKKAVVDPQGKTVQRALEQMGYQGIQGVHVGKYLEIEITGEVEEARRQIDEACHKLLSNPVIEDYHFVLE
jgi:phosphoribosylformylglycinamidine synthase subunit PurS